MKTRPNVICIMSDEHDPAVTGCYGDPLVQTPNLNRLANEGIVFENCYCNSPLCVPSRHSFTTGKYVSRIDVWNNDCEPASSDIVSLPHILNNAGYDSVLCGKQHYSADRRYGFRDIMGNGSNNDKKSGKINRREPGDEHLCSSSWENRSDDFHSGDSSKILNHDRKVTQNATQFISERTIEEEPFFLFVGYLAPHFPLIAPQENYERYKDQVPMPEIPEGLLENLPLNYQHLRRGFGTPLATDEITQKGRDLYWALTDWFDGEVGKVLNALEQSEVADNTIIIYTSDHGENKGDHGLWWKNCMYEHGARVPLIVKWPERWAGGQRRKGACSLVDLVQTITEVAGEKAPEDWDGDSLLPWMDNPDFAWKDSALCEYYGHNIASGFTMLRQGAFKYVYHARINDEFGAQRELYNLDTDPKEFQNLAENPEYSDRVRDMHKAMVKELGEEPDAIERRCRAQKEYV